MLGVIEIPASVYDQLEALANSLGGVGWGNSFDNDSTPRCVRGMLCQLTGNEDTLIDPRLCYGITIGMNDRVVSAYVDRARYGRMPWPAYVEAMGITRG